MCCIIQGKYCFEGGIAMLKEGIKAPAFALPDQNGTVHSLDEYRGRKVILYFYSKDMTSGCSKQACGFAERYPQFTEKGAVILGVSKDTVASHKKFEEKYGLPFTLLSDPDLETLRAYDVIKMKKTDKGDKPQTIRTTYLIDEEGVIVRSMSKVNATDNPGQMLELL
jgi:peroxiredoxin Q/BCP